MTGFRVFMRPGGWRVTDGAEEFGPYPTYQQAVTTAQNLNHQRRAAEERSFAPRDASLVAPEFRTGPDREAHLVASAGAKVKVLHGRAPATDLPPQMVSETGGGAPDRPIGDVLEYRDEGSVWEAREDASQGAPADEERSAREAVDRARVSGGDGPAQGSASRGGGLV